MWEAGAYDVDPVETGLGIDLLLVALPAHPVVADLELEVLSHLPAVGLFAERGVDAVAVLGPGLSPLRARGDLGQHAFGGREQLLAFSGPIVPQARVETDEQAFAGEARAGDLGDLIVDELLGAKRRLDLLPGLRRDEQLSGLDRLEGRDPVESGGPDVLADPRGREHPPIPDEGDPLDAEALLELGDLAAHRRRITGVAGEDIDGHRTSPDVAEKPVGDLLLPLLAIAVVTVCEQRAAPAFHEARADVVEDQCASGQLPPCETPLDMTLAAVQPVEHGQHLVAGDVSETEDRAEARGRRAGGKLPRGGELRGGGDDPGDDGSEGELAVAGVLAVEDAREAELFGEAEDGGDVAVGQGSPDRDGVIDAGEDGAALEDGPEPVDNVGRQLREVGDRLVAHAFAFAPGLSKEGLGGAAAVGDDIDAEGHVGPRSACKHTTGE